MKRLTFVILSMFLIFTMWGQTSRVVDVSSPGTLNSLLGADKNVITDLTLTGTLNDVDFQTIREMQAIKNIDMANANCVDNKLPDRAFENKKLETLSIPSTTIELGAFSFSGTTLNSFKIPHTIRKIRNDVFRDMTITKLDFNLINSLENIDWNAFHNLTLTQENILDLSKHNSLQMPNYQHLGTFSGFSGHVIFPRLMTEIPIYCFSRFNGSVDLPEGLRVIRETAFKEAKPSQEIILPSTVKVIEGDAFSGMVTSKLDLTRISSLETLYHHAFYNLTLTQENILDLSKHNSLQMPNYQHLGTFSGFSGHVVFPRLMTEIPIYCFSRFNGSVDLPEGLSIIKNHAFDNALIKEILLPSTVNTINEDAFINCSQLTKLTSPNSTPPALGSNVFNGVDKSLCTLFVPQASIPDYGSANQWKDFLNYKAHIPQKVDLVHSIFIDKAGGTSHDYWDHYKYKGHLIGEHYWSDVLNDSIPPFTWWTASVWEESAYPPTEALFDLYMEQIWIDYYKYNPDPNEFLKYYGKYYNFFDRIHYINNPGMTHMTENNDPSITGWSLANTRDFRQLFGMCPFYGGQQKYRLDEHDVYRALSPKAGENPLAFNIEDDWSNPHKVFWFNHDNLNLGGFSMMPTGWRAAEDNQTWKNNLPDKHHANGVHVSPKGGFALLFYSSQYGTVDGLVRVHDRVDTYYGQHGEWMPIRWCRRLTDEELGYKLFIKINGLDENSSEIQSLASNDEIPLLKYLYYNSENYSCSDFDILKLDYPVTTVPSGYVELPSGYIRGFYVQHLLQSASPKSICDVMTYAINVDDNAIWQANISGETSLPEKYFSSTLRRASSLEVSKTSEIKIHPNPVVDQLNIESSETIEQAHFYNASGKLVMNEEKVGSQINVSVLPKGIYILKLKTATDTKTFKVVKE